MSWALSIQCVAFPSDLWCWHWDNLIYPPTQKHFVHCTLFLIYLAVLMVMVSATDFVRNWLTDIVLNWVIHWGRRMCLHCDHWHWGRRMRLHCGHWHWGRRMCLHCGHWWHEGCHNDSLHGGRGGGTTAGLERWKSSFFGAVTCWESLDVLKVYCLSRLWHKKCVDWVYLNFPKIIMMHFFLRMQLKISAQNINHFVRASAWKWTVFLLYWDISKGSEVLLLHNGTSMYYVIVINILVTMQRIWTFSRAYLFRNTHLG